jgi:hypothetical protein
LRRSGAVVNPDPGYGRMGIYGGGPSWLDYEMPKMQLDGAFPLS